MTENDNMQAKLFDQIAQVKTKTCGNLARKNEAFLELFELL